MSAAKTHRKPAPDSYQILNVWSQVHTWTLLYSGITKHSSHLKQHHHAQLLKILVVIGLDKLSLWQSGVLNPNHWYCSTPTTTIKSTVLGWLVLSANRWPHLTKLYLTLLWYLLQQFTLRMFFNFKKKWQNILINKYKPPFPIVGCPIFFFFQVWF